jgi:hypothetical protein
MVVFAQTLKNRSPLLSPLEKNEQLHKAWSRG